MNIITGFVGGINRRKDRDLSKYAAFGRELMSVEIPMTVFVERSFFLAHIMPHIREGLGGVGEFVYECRGGFMDGILHQYSYEFYGRVTFVFFEKTDLFLWPHRDMASKFALNTGNPDKDTLEYMMVQCQKSEWLAIASQMGARGEKGTGLKEYVWVDFGAFHMFRGKSNVFQRELCNMRARVDKRLHESGESMRMLFAHCWDPNRLYGGDIYKDINWSFAGSVFGGGTGVVQIFAEKMRDKCFQILHEKNTLMWEINIWLLIYRESSSLFYLYPSDHSEILFRGYV